MCGVSAKPLSSLLVPCEPQTAPSEAGGGLWSAPGLWQSLVSSWSAQGLPDNSWSLVSMQ